MPGYEPGRWPTALVGAGVLAGAALALVAMVFSGSGSRVAHAAPAPGAAAAYQTTDRLLVSVGLDNPGGRVLDGKLQVEVRDDNGQVLANASREIRQAEASVAHRFELPALKRPPAGLTLVCRFGDQQTTVPLTSALVVKAHEATVAGSSEVHAGGKTALRLAVHGVKSLTETVPLAGAEVAISLHGPNGKSHALHETRTGADGSARAEFRVPELPPGQYKLRVATKSGLGAETVERDVQVKSTSKVLLVTDKPLYQPGQVIHLRALALRPFDLKPIAGQDLTLEVEDPKGNKVFKRTHKTSEHGIAAEDFQLADEVNMGAYRVRALLGEHQADKTVEVKKYVLPKFKVELKADKRYYLPKETVKAELQADYFFGKPVAKGKVKVTASTFDVAFRAFQTWEGTTDEQGHVKFEIKLPDYFVGQPLQKGDALVRIEAQLTDTADHAETAAKTYPVANEPIRITLIPEGGRLVPEVENRVYAAATYPDGSPAKCQVLLWQGQKPQGDGIESLKTNDAGLAEFKVTPREKQLRQGPFITKQTEMLGLGQIVPITQAVPQILFDLYAEAKDTQGNVAKTTVAVNCEPIGENVMLRLDKAVYRGGDRLQADILTSAGLPTVYLDVVRGGQVVLSQWLDVKNGKATSGIELTSDIFGTVEVHAYQMIASGEIIRDSRAIYVQPADGLNVQVKADREEYQPGAAGKIAFQVTDKAGKPAGAALGVIIVDEAVYALQDLQPGLEKLYFTLQEELLKPQAQAVYKPNESIDDLVRVPELAADKQQIAQVLLTAVKPKPPQRWEVSPVVERRQRLQTSLQQVGMALFQHAHNNATFLAKSKDGRGWEFKPGLLAELGKSGWVDPGQLKGPFGEAFTLEMLASFEKRFTAAELAKSVAASRLGQLRWIVGQRANQQRATMFKNNQWVLPETILADAVKPQGWDVAWLKDPWGQDYKLIRLDKKRAVNIGLPQLDFYDIVSAGPDGKFGTADDVTADVPHGMFGNWWMDGFALERAGMDMRFGARFDRGGMPMGGMGGGFAGGMPMPMAAAPGGPGGGGGVGGPPAPAAAVRAKGEELKKEAKADAAGPADGRDAGGGGGGSGGGEAPITRIREYFPETMLWRPALITDAQGRAELSVDFADSITTWRLTASASSAAGALGGATVPLRVFQDFFVDLDLPVSLTQNDEVAFPVAVYNYMKEKQTVRLELQPEAWFELLDDAGPVRSLTLQPGEVTSVKYRIRAKRIGNQPLTVKAIGTKLSDAIKRVIEVLPDGTKVEAVYSDRLEGKVTQKVTIPAHAVPDASKLIVKLYPGVFAQVLEGTEGMLRLPGG